MGVCASCLGRGGRDSHDSESSRLLDDELYQSGYGYGSVGSVQRQARDPEYLKREREALEAICQRTSDSVVDIWALQPHQSGYATLSLDASTASSSRVASHETATSATSDGQQYSVSPQYPTNIQKTQSLADGARRDASPVPGEFGRLRYAPLTISKNINLSAVPKHWGEVVMTTRKGKKTRPGLNTDRNGGKSKDLFGVLVVD
ncbi:hypothetical protein PAAG_01216 [Paracoccidioides lutzii Pb01]|uniref:Late endosomal/lysosomal adaptor and MAPK and MTOR activator-domain-containing protein n=1 Tax=Paracoccidioides lutzii (strain ATCC MYA-826 / Pb01) TaxID=502779 RepID=C1GRS1_PARBA|nr:hypothetical protein PAAG_01216 [Paracoccidioides lutzii Pb01]EEH38295.1 hypothetical protein PAAG_01216 [Paracoccidioides lutzii Pb01]